MGLPATTRCPRATVRRRAGALELRFSGPACDERLDLDARLLGGADLEAEELRLLGELARLGYEVQRLAPEGES